MNDETTTLCDSIKAKIHEEFNDMKKYTELAEKAGNEGHNKLAKILQDIASDEQSHYFYLTRIVDEM